MATVSPADVQRIAAIESPVLRNLEITHAYSLLAAAVAERGSSGANWCVFATWASRQAGATIRGEDALDVLTDRLGGGSLLHPLRTFGRWLLRRGLLNRGSRLGRLMGRLHTPFDAVELASDAVARGNRKVFEEIGYEFARWLAAADLDTFLSGLRAGDPPDGQRLLRSAFTRYSDPASGPQELLLANLEIGLHEQTRLQPEICEALDAATITAEELGRRLCPNRRPRVQKAAGLLAAPVQGWLAELSREIITHSLMVLSVPGRILLLGANLDDPFPEVLRVLSDEELAALVAMFEPSGVDHSGATDWSDLHQRMHYIVHLFRAFHEDRVLFDAPFTPVQVKAILAGVIPDGDL
ncbi:hypothetical protein [Solirubrobacter ginsenosidimutans]|uniref:hypothetical protein n=1 Tax=Solirubrobacter ginsenosidimutans TaxID=490573 RepID=UPI0022CDC4DC|nr:hypothetical protein [Solirubrobacter ginsenosidimutans]